MLQKIFNLFGRSKVSQFIAAIIITMIVAGRAAVTRGESISDYLIMGTIIGVLAGLALTNIYYLLSFLFNTIGMWFLYAKYIKSDMPFKVDSFSITNSVFVILGISFFIIGSRKLYIKYAQIKNQD